MAADWLRHLEYVRRYRELAEGAVGAERQAMLRMVKRFERGAIQIEKSAEQLAECRELLSTVEQLLRR